MTFLKVKEIFENVTGDDNLKLNYSSSFKELGINRESVNQAIEDIEREYDISITNSDKIKTFGELMGFINALNG